MITMKKLLTLLSLLPVVGFGQTFVGSGGSIPDFPGGQQCFPVNVSGLSQNLYSGSGLVSVQVNITHTYDADLEIVLVSPTGIQTILSSNNGGSGDNYTNTIFNMSAVNPVQSGTAPFSGSYIPEESFYAQNSGQNGNGIWTLCITDDLGGNTGTLNGWSITFGSGAIGVPVPNPNPPASDLCSSAPLICNLNGYTGSTSSSYTWTPANEPSGTAQPTPGPAGTFCGTEITNSSWIRFQASATTVNLTVDVMNCTGSVASCGEFGIQLALYNACGAPWSYSPSAIPPVSTGVCQDDEKSPSCYGDGIHGTGNVLSFNNLVVGNIYYIMFDGWAANQCDYTINVTNGVQVVNITPSSNPMCQGDTIDLVASAPGTLNTYSWSSVPPGSYANGQTISVSPSSTTVFTVTASGICGSQSATLPVTVTPSGDPAWGTPSPVCENAANIDLSSYITGTTGGSWSGPGVTGSSFDPSGQTGNVQIVYTTGTAPCQRTDTNTVTVLPVPDPHIMVNGPTAICAYQNVLLTAPSPLSGSYSWNTGSTNDSVWTTMSGQYIVTITSANGCFDRDTLNLTVTNYPAVNAVINPAAPVICPGAPATLGLTTAYTAYVWSTSSVASSIQVAVPGIYSVIVTDNNGCMDTAQVNVIASSLAVSISGNTEICSYESATLTASGNYTYAWSNAQTGNSVNVSAGGWYWVDASDTLGCVVRDSTYVTRSSLSASITGDPAICAQNDSAMITATTATSYLWNTGALTQSIYVFTPGVYTVIENDTLGCSDTASYTVSLSPVAASITGDTIACNDQAVVLTATGGGAYSWSTGSTSADISVIVTQTSSYAVTVTNADGCTASAMQTVYLYSSLYSPPSGLSDSATTQINVPVLIDITDNDSAQNAVISILSGPSNGTVSIVGDQVQYTPNAGYAGNDDFYYLLCSDFCGDYCDTVHVTIKINTTELIFPEFISPNKDGANDTWVITGLENYPDHEVIIMNRWGDVLYTAKPYGNDWSGQSNTGLVMINGSVTDGTYFFVFIPSPGEDPVKGFIELRK